MPTAVSAPVPAASSAISDIASSPVRSCRRSIASASPPPPRVARIDVDYTYPASLGLAPRTEMDGGDVYAPSGTSVRLHIHTEHPVAKGRLALSAGGIGRR